MLLRILALLSLSVLLLQCGNPKTATPSPSHPGETIPQKLSDEVDFQGANCMVHAANLVKTADRSPGTPGAEEQRRYIIRELAKHGWACREQAFDASTPQGTKHFVNIRARFKSAPDFNSTLPGILSCHIDTKTGIPGFTGANDGASGIAAILETARILASDPNRAEQVELVFFDGEECFGKHMDDEDGLYGSKYYAASLKEPLPSWMINLDMVGRQGKKIRIPMMSAPRLYRAYTSAVRELGYSQMEWGISGQGILDDHLPLEERGIETLNLIDDFLDGNWWHTAQDNLNILGAESFKHTGELTLHLLRQLLP